MAKVQKKHIQLAEDFYTKTYQGRILVEGKVAGPKTIAKLKELMAAAKAAGGKMSAAAQKYFKERGITLKPKAGEAKAPEKKPEAKAPETKKEEKRAATSAVSKTDEQKLRDTLDELKRAGAENVPSYTKETSKEKLADSVQAVIDGLLKAHPKAAAAQDKLDPEAMERANQECIGVFPDMKSPSCLSCSYKPECARQFVGNVKNQFAKFKVEAKEESGTKELTGDKETLNKVAKAVKQEKKEEPKKNGKSKLDTSWTLAVNDLSKPEDAGIAKGKSDEEKAQYAMVSDILVKVPDTVGDLRKIVDSHFEGIDDGVFAQIVKSLESEQIVMVERP